MLIIRPNYAYYITRRIAMKNKVWSLSLIIISLLSNNIYAADKTVQAIPSNTNIYITGEDENKKADGLALYSIWGYNYIKLRDIGYLMNYNIIWDDESKEIHVSKGNETIESSNIYMEAEVKNAVSVNQAIYVNDEKHENLTAYNIDGYTYFKLRDIGEILNFSCTWDAETNSVFLDQSKGDIDETVGYTAIDDFANNYLKETLDRKVISGYDCKYNANSEDYKDISNYIQKSINSNFNDSYYSISEITSKYNYDNKQHDVITLTFYFNAKGYSYGNIGYRVYAIDGIAKIITTIGSKNDDFDITKLKAPDITDEELIDMAVKADHNSYKVSETNVKRYFDMNDLKFKGDVEVTYIDNSECYFATLNTFELE